MKKFIAFLLCAVMVLSLAACGKNNDNGKKDDKENVESTKAIDDSSNQTKTDEKIIQDETTPTPTDEITATPEITAEVTPEPTGEVTPEPTQEPLPEKTLSKPEDFEGTWFMHTYSIEGSEVSASMDSNFTQFVISKLYPDDPLNLEMSIGYRRNFGIDSVNLTDEHLFGEIIDLPETNSNCLYFDFTDSNGCPETFYCHLNEDGTMTVEHFFTYDNGTVPVVAEYVFSKTPVTAVNSIEKE